ncbi:MAG TPA: hypothetical protein VFX17_04190 [Patescibacteria group bacterium]|nr:hypothetical protein [Patescibacteria group bacterium]
MEQNSASPGKWYASRRTWTTVVVVVIVAAIVYFGFIKPNGSNPQNSNTQTEQGDQNQTNVSGDNQASDNTNSSGTQTQNTTNATTGNVAASGTLMVSDNPARGNLMVASPSGNIYIATKRDFGSLVGKQVNLSASGTLNQFTFLDLADASLGAVDTMARGGVAEGGQVQFTGVLKRSDNARGNYVLVSGATSVYLRTVHNYDSWLDSTVHLQATGSLQSFTQAFLTK